MDMSLLHWTAWMLLIVGWGSCWIAIAAVVGTLGRFPRLLNAGLPTIDLSMTAMSKAVMLLALMNSISHGYALLEWLQIRLAIGLKFGAPINYTIAHLFTHVVTFSYCIMLRRAERIGGESRELVE